MSPNFRVLFLLFVLSTGYDKVLCNMNGIITAVKSTPDATDILTGNYKQKRWINITGKPTKEELVTLALQRMKQDPRQYNLFIDMLCDM